MRESTIIPTNLLNWPRVAPLLPELKLILYASWGSPHVSTCGVGLIPIRPFASTLGLSVEATVEGVAILEEKGLLACDQTTGEIFIKDWFRFHKFATGKSYGMLLTAVEKIESQQLKNLVRSLLPPPPSLLNRSPAAPFGAADTVDESTGVIVRNQQDRELLANLVDQRGAEVVRERAEEARRSGLRPFVSVVADRKDECKGPNGGRSRGLDGVYDPSKPPTPPVSKL